MDIIWRIVLKEWSEVFKNKVVLLAVVFVPLVFTAISLTVFYSMEVSGDFNQSLQNTSDIPQEFLELCGELQGIECMQYFIVSQFLILFLIMPIVIPGTIASYSIVGEKTTHTLEPLLAAPISALELLAGKGFAAAIPAILATWGSYAVFAIGSSILAVSPAVTARLLSGLWLIAILLVSPLLSIASVSISVMISSRVNDPRVAEQLSGLVVLPLMALFLGQAFGLIQLNESLIIWIALLLMLLDAIFIVIAIQLFQRETILTRWK